MSRNKMILAGTQWEDLRRQARQLENEIDIKLVSFSKLDTSYTTFPSTSSSTPLLAKGNGDHIFETITLEIEQMLAKLTEVNNKLAECTQNGSFNPQSAALLHTLQRHRDILQDYAHEYHKTKANIMQHREREELMGSIRKDISAFRTGNKTDLYLKEHDHLRSSEILVDEQISLATATKENLQKQRLSLRNIRQRVIAVTNRFPVINSLVQRISLRKRRDTIILACVIAVCLILLLFFSFR